MFVVWWFGCLVMVQASTGERGGLRVVYCGSTITLAGAQDAGPCRGDTSRASWGIITIGTHILTTEPD